MPRLLVMIIGVLLSFPPYTLAFDARQFDAHIEKALTNWEIPGASIAVIQGGEVIHLRGYGERIVGSGKKVDADTVFAVGSNGKSFTSVMLGTLVDEGLISFDDPLVKHLPEFRLRDAYASQHTTFADALGHMTGLGEQSGLAVWYVFGRDRSAVVRSMAFMEPASSFRSTFAYNNAGFVAAGEAAAAITSTPYETLVEERIFKPLGMTRSSVSLEGTRIDKNVAQPHEYVDGKMVTVPYHDASGAAPAGAVNSTARDMARYLQMMMNMGKLGDTRVLSPETAARIQRPRIAFAPTELPDIQMVTTVLENPALGQSMSYALGLGTFVYNGVPLVMHGGSIDGMKSWMVWSPEEKIGYVCLTNGNNMFIPAVLMYEALNPLLGLPRDDVAGRLLPMKAQMTGSGGPAVLENPAPASQTITDLVGEYSNDIGTFSLKKKGSGVRVTILPSGFKGDLVHYNANSYRIIPDNPALGRGFLTVEYAKDGSIAAMMAGDGNGPGMFALAPRFDKQN